MAAGFSIADSDLSSDIRPVDVHSAGQRVIQVCKALSENDRLRVLCLLHTKEECVEDMCRKMSISQPGLSHHLALLRTMGILRNDHRGRYQFYSISHSGKHALRESGESLLQILPHKTVEEVQPLAPLSLGQLLEPDNTISATGADLAKRFNVIGEEMRASIMSLLSGREQTVSALCAVLGETQPAVSHHLACMKKAELLQSRREGRFSFYSVSPVGAQRIHQAGNILQQFGADSSEE